MTDSKTFGARIIIRDKELIKNIATAKSKVWLDGKIRDTNVSYVEYCVRIGTRIILEEY